MNVEQICEFAMAAIDIAVNSVNKYFEENTGKRKSFNKNVFMEYEQKGERLLAYYKGVVFGIIQVAEFHPNKTEDDMKIIRIARYSWDELFEELSKEQSQEFQELAIWYLEKKKGDSDV